MVNVLLYLLRFEAQIMRIVWFGFFVLAAVITGAQTYPDQGGAQITKPFQRKVTGAVCFTGAGKLAGNVFFNFPTQDKKALAFTIGSSAPGQEKNEAFNGAGKYSDIAIFLKPLTGDSVLGRGEVVVNDDEHSGTFTFKTTPTKKKGDDDEDDDDGSASGTWDCGRKLTH